MMLILPPSLLPALPPRLRLLPLHLITAPIMNLPRIRHPPLVKPQRIPAMRPRILLIPTHLHNIRRPPIMTQPLPLLYLFINIKRTDRMRPLRKIIPRPILSLPLPLSPGQRINHTHTLGIRIIIRHLNRVDPPAFILLVLLPLPDLQDLIVDLLSFNRGVGFLGVRFWFVGFGDVEVEHFDIVDFLAVDDLDEFEVGGLLLGGAVGHVS